MPKIENFIELTPRTTIETAEKYAEGTRYTPIHRVLAMAFSNGARSVVVEEEPVDTEYEAEHKSFLQYVTAYKLRGKPVRLHLFRDPVRSHDDFKKNPGYLGYLDVRPTDRTICWADLDRSILTRPDNKYLFLTCCRRKTINLGGAEFAWEGFPYMQQDGVAVRCAQAALAVITDYLKVAKTGPEFTNLTALESPTAHRALPSSGLNARQICMGIRHMQHEPLLYEYGKPDDPRRQTIAQTVYCYIESEIPVLLGIQTSRGYHAIVAVGHTFTPDSWMTQSEPAYYSLPDSGLSLEWVRRFVVQDDNFGPYTLIPTEVLGAITFLIAVPLPEHVYLTGEEALPLAKYILSPKGNNIVAYAYQSIDKQLADSGLVMEDETWFWRKRLCNAAANNSLVLRPRLTPGASFRKELETATGAAKDAYADAAGKIEFPEYVWKIELSWPQIFCHQRLRAGELVLDATHPLRLNMPPQQQGLLWLRLPGGVLFSNLQSETIGLHFIKNDDLIREHFMHA